MRVLDSLEASEPLWTTIEIETSGPITLPYGGTLNRSLLTLSLKPEVSHEERS